MQLRVIAPMAVAVAFSVSGVAARQGEFTAKADIRGTGITGTAELREFSLVRGATIPASGRSAPAPVNPHTTGTKGVEIVITVTGLTPGQHGMHLHAVGKCEAPGFTTAGGHFDPGPAANPDPDVNHPFHMGDLPNLMADANGRAQLTAVTSRVTLGAGPLSVFDEDGTAIIIHGNPDQGISGAPRSGVSGGPRVACGVIVKP
jgi:Cu/Zn superoxide dismutase